MNSEKLLSRKIYVSPIVRFAGFTEKWKENKIKDLLNERNEHSGDGELISVTINSGIVKTADLVRIDNSSKDKSNYKKVKKGDIAYNSMRMWQGASGLSKYTGIVSPAYTIVIPNERVFPLFISYQFKFPGMIQIFQTNSQGLTSDTWNLKYPLLKKIKIKIPELDEQVKIGNFFKQLDDTIIIQQQLLNDHKQLKKAMQQKMFPKKGEKIPKVRFAGFTDEWKEYKSKDIFCSISDKNHPDLPVLSASQQKGMIYRSDINIDIQYNKESTKTYKRVVPGQFVIHLRSFQGGFAYSNIEGITSPAYTVIDFKCKDSQKAMFWKHILTSNSFIKTLETITYGIRDGRSISFSEFSTLKFRFPSYDEQDKISTFFDILDSLIASNQKKLETYQELKKAMLQKMFV